MAAVIEYQGNNSGRTPFKDINYGITYHEQDEHFINRYIDPQVTYNKSKPVHERTSNCSDKFIDPVGGRCYTFYPHGAYDGKGKGENYSFADSGMFWVSELYHPIYVWIRASCGTNEGTINEEPGERNIAMFYRLEGNALYCVDNS